MKQSYAMHRQMIVSTGFALHWDSSLQCSAPRSERPELSKQRLVLGQQFIVLTPPSISMPGTIVWPGTLTLRSRMCPETPQSYHSSAQNISVSKRLSSEQHKLDNGTHSVRGYGTLGHLTNNVEHGRPSVSNHSCQSI